MTNPPLRLKKDQDRRVRAGHLWIYSNEVDTDKTPFDQFEPGQVVAVENAQGKWQGLAYVNPNSLICARLVTRQRDLAFDGSLFVHRIKVALSLRERLYHAPYYRLIFGEGDALPGVVVDRYCDYLVVQITTADMECHQDAVLEALEAGEFYIFTHPGYRSVTDQRSRSIADAFDRATASPVLAEIGEQEGVFQANESMIIKNLLRFHTIDTKSIMTPRTVVLAAAEEMTLQAFHDANRKPKAAE